MLPLHLLFSIVIFQKVELKLSSLVFKDRYFRKFTACYFFGCSYLLPFLSFFVHLTVKFIISSLLLVNFLSDEEDSTIPFTRLAIQRLKDTTPGVLVPLGWTLLRRFYFLRSRSARAKSDHARSEWTHAWLLLALLRLKAPAYALSLPFKFRAVFNWVS